MTNAQHTPGEWEQNGATVFVNYWLDARCTGSKQVVRCIEGGRGPH